MIELDFLAGALAIPLGIYVLMRIGRWLMRDPALRDSFEADIGERILFGIAEAFIGLLAVGILGAFILFAIKVGGFITRSHP